MNIYQEYLQFTHDQFQTVAKDKSRSLDVIVSLTRVLYDRSDDIVELIRLQNQIEECRQFLRTDPDDDHTAEELEGAEEDRASVLKKCEQLSTAFDWVYKLACLYLPEDAKRLGVLCIGSQLATGEAGTDVERIRTELVQLRGAANFCKTDMHRPIPNEAASQRDRTNVSGTTGAYPIVIEFRRIHFLVVNEIGRLTMPRRPNRSKLDGKSLQQKLSRQREALSQQLREIPKSFFECCAISYEMLAKRYALTPLAMEVHDSFHRHAVNALLLSILLAERSHHSEPMFFEAATGEPVGNDTRIDMALDPSTTTNWLRKEWAVFMSELDLRTIPSLSKSFTEHTDITDKMDYFCCLQHKDPDVRDLAIELNCRLPQQTKNAVVRSFFKCDRKTASRWLERIDTYERRKRSLIANADITDKHAGLSST